MDNLPTPKQIAALAKACRKSGIRSFKGGGIEFTLDDVEQAKAVKKEQLQTAYQNAVDPSSEDTLEGDALLFWSAPTAQEQDNKN